MHRFVPASHIVYNIIFDIAAESIPHVIFFASNGVDKLLQIELRRRDRQLVVNDCIDGNWGGEQRLSAALSSGDVDNELNFKFNGSRFEIWNSVEALELARFDRETLEAMYFFRLENAIDGTGTLTYSDLNFLGNTRYSSIENVILNHRISELERQIQLLSAKIDAGAVKR